MLFRSLALKIDHSLWAWGNNDFGQCGFGPDDVTPNRVGAGNDWVAVAASGDTDPFSGTHSMGLRSDGSLWAWGKNDWGELGFDTIGLPSVPTRVGVETNWASIAAGCADSFARKRDGSLWAWGILTGFGSVPITMGTTYDWWEFAVGGSAALSPPFATAIKTDGSLWRWAPGNPPLQVGTQTNWGSPP